MQSTLYGRKNALRLRAMYAWQYTPTYSVCETLRADLGGVQRGMCK
jgi:hypothetical protein